VCTFLDSILLADSIQTADIDIESALKLRHQLNQYRQISRNDVRSGPVYSPVHANDDDVCFDTVFDHEMLQSAHLNHAMDVRQQELQQSGTVFSFCLMFWSIPSDFWQRNTVAQWKHMGPQQANQIKVLHKMLSMRDRLRNLRDRFASDQMRSNLDLSSGVSLLDPLHCVAAPANAALLPHISKSVCLTIYLSNLF
jgi:hypothetical protein